MKRKEYKALKELTKKIENGTANFKERNLYTILQKKKNKGQKINFKTNE